MTTLFSILFIIFSTLAWAQENSLLEGRGKFVPPKEVYDLAEMNRVLFSEVENQNNDLKRVKYYLINGDIRLARLYLQKLAYTQTKLRPLIYRYLATLAFMDTEFAKVYEYLSLPELNNIPHYGKVCVLKVLSQLVLNKTSELENSWGRCKAENAKFSNEANLVWVDTLVNLKTRPVRGITSAPFKIYKLTSFTVEEAKVILKLAIYLNQEELVKDQITELTLEYLRDSEIRELAGQIFFRTGSFAKAYKYVEDLKSPNSENIKGNLYVLRGKYELAYAQFKLALEQKQNSQNAVERILPIAWLLGDWEGGARYADYVIASAQNRANKLTLKAAFLIQKGDYPKAESTLDYIAYQTRRGNHIEVAQLASFNYLMQNKMIPMRKQAKISCEQYDVVNCWLLFQINMWDNFGLTIRRKEELPEKKEWQKLVTEDLNDPLKETVFVNQIDIEEMDDKLISLIPQKK